MTSRDNGGVQDLVVSGGDEGAMGPDRSGQKLEDHWLDHPANIRRLWQGFLCALALTVLAQFITDMHPHFAVEAIPGFGAWFGFLACVVMIVAAKALGAILKRPDNYYDDDHG